MNARTGTRGVGDGKVRRVVAAAWLAAALTAGAQAPQAFHFDVTADPHMGTTNRALATNPDKTFHFPEFRGRGVTS